MIPVVYIASDVLPTRFSSHVLTKKLVEKIAAASKTGVYPVDWLASGKPVFTAGGRYISVSHTGDRLFVAVCVVPIGLDAEARREIPERVRKEWLSPAEQRQDFFKVWTAKEAVAKWTGEGLGAVRRVFVRDRVAMLDNQIYSLFRDERDGVVITVAARDCCEIVWV